MATSALSNTIQATLAGAAAVTALVSTRIHDTQPPQGVDLPYVLFTEVDLRPRGAFAADYQGLDFQVDIYANKHVTADTPRAIRDAVYAALHRQTLTPTGYKGFHILCESQGTLAVEADFYRVTMEFSAIATPN